MSEHWMFSYDATVVVGVALGGALGAVVRNLVDGAVQRCTKSRHPLGILAVNVSGSLLLAVVVGLFAADHISATAKFALATGFCGAYTTFSTFALDTVALAERGQRGAAASNVVLNVVLCGAAAAIGLALT